MIRSILISISVLIFVLSSIPVNSKRQDQDWTKCVEKYKSKWGAATKMCPASKNSYTIWLRNICNEHVDVKCAVQEKDKRWRTFSRLNFAPKDSMTAFACNGTGKYLYWVHQSGDSSAEFPSDEKINTDYVN